MIWCPGRMLALPQSAGLWRSRAVPGIMRMRLLSAVIVAIVLSVSVAAEGAPLSAPQSIDIPQKTGALHALLYKPDGDGPFPTVIALHGCDGLVTHAEAILPRYRDWAEQLLQ